MLLLLFASCVCVKLTWWSRRSVTEYSWTVKHRLSTLIRAVSANPLIRGKYFLLFWSTFISFLLFPSFTFSVFTFPFFFSFRHFWYRCCFNRFLSYIISVFLSVLSCIITSLAISLSHFPLHSSHFLPSSFKIFIFLFQWNFLLFFIVNSPHFYLLFSSVSLFPSDSTSLYAFFVLLNVLVSVTFSLNLFRIFLLIFLLLPTFFTHTLLVRI